MLCINNLSKLRGFSYLYIKTSMRLSVSSSITFNSSMKKLMDSKQYQNALNSFECESQLHTDNSINMAIRACTELRDYERGNNIIKQLSADLFDNQYTQTLLLRFYIQCNDLDSANHIFSTMKNKSNFAYTIMFKGFISNKMAEKVFNLLDTMTIQPDAFTLSTVFKACAQVNSVQAKAIGNKLLNQMPNYFRNNVILINSAISMMMRFGDVANAQELFESIKRKDIVSYGAMMKGYVENDMSEKALDLFEQISINTNNNIYAIIFKACAEVADERAKKLGKKVLDRILNKTDIDHVALHSAIHMLMRFGDVMDANRIFESIENKDTFSYGVMLKGYVENRMFEEVLDLFEQMSVKPDDVIYTIIFTTCAKLKNERARKIGKQLLDRISNISEANKTLLHSGINMLMKLGDVNGAEHLFRLIKERDVVTYGAIMQGYLENDMSERVLDLCEQNFFNLNDVICSIIFKACAHVADERAKLLGRRILRQTFNQSQASNTLLTSTLYMLMKFGDFTHAENLFESIRNKDISTYASMMKAYNLNRQPLQCLQLFQTILKQGSALDDETIFSLCINACSQIGILAVCESLVGKIPSHLYSKPHISNVLINMWGKAGCVKSAQEIFTTMIHPDIVAYNSMINAFGLNGRGLEAVDLFQQMPTSMRNEISYISVLNACSHAGLLNEARAIFEQISIKTKRITTTMIDCLSRLFLFDEAEKMLAEYEKSNVPCPPMYMAIISGARNCRESVVSERVFNRMKTLFPDQKNALVSGSILLANIYSSLGDDEQATITQSNRRINYGNKVKPGLTWTEKDGEIVEFGAHDHSHPLSSEIHAESKKILYELHEHGFRSDPSWITRPLAENETVESVLCGHSEKLAIAFHFIHGRRPSFIQATKNLRVCGDCHQATKFIAKIRQCEIVIRDANRIHHFSKNGNCSCQDHF